MLMSGAMGDMTHGNSEPIPLYQTLLSSLVPDLRAGFGGRWIGAHMAGRKGTSFSPYEISSADDHPPLLKNMLL